MKKDIFYNKMKMLLNEEADDFFESFNRELNKGIRYNKLKIDKDSFEKLIPFEIEQIPWCDEGFYFSDKEARPGTHPYYHAGLYYIQEPSAMLPVEALGVSQGEKVLDISAAPGGKSTQIASKLGNEGLLVANDINPKRAIALQKNISMCGALNSIVVNKKPEILKNIFFNYFDKILVDAPCSGEGLIKKDIDNYEPDNSKYCEVQKTILNEIKDMLVDGGEVVYSTCTFSPEENEGIIDWFIKENDEFEIVDIDIKEPDFGHPEWVNGIDDLVKTRRAWPHKLRGEGHFLAKIKKKTSSANNSKYQLFKINSKGIDAYLEFAKEYGLREYYLDNVHNINGQLYRIPDNLKEIDSRLCLNIGIYLGEIKNSKFMPSQELAASFRTNDFQNIINFESSDIRVNKYLKGETIEADGNDGWCLVCVDGYPLGFGKNYQGTIKNYYKKQWRVL